MPLSVLSTGCGSGSVNPFRSFNGVVSGSVNPLPQAWHEPRVGCSEQYGSTHNVVLHLGILSFFNTSFHFPTSTYPTLSSVW
jgi:hypothetical protein